MKKRDEDDAKLEQAFQELLGGHLEKWDAEITPPVMNAAAFERLVRERKEALRSRYRMERYVFWLISVIVLGGMLLLWQSSLVLFAGLQALVFAGAGGFLFKLFLTGRRERRRTWPDGK